MKKGPLLLIGTLLLAVMFGVVSGLYAQPVKSAQDINDIGEIVVNYDDVSGSIASPTSPQPASITSVPTMNEWGMIVFVMLAGLLAVLTLKRRRG